MADQVDLMEKLYVNLPLPLSKWVHTLMRSTVKKNPRQPLFEMAFRRLAANRIPGDYLEFGVYRGSSFVTNWRLAQRYGLDDMRFFAFDTFAGLPEGEGSLWKPGMYSCSKERFINIVRKAGVPTNKVFPVEGLYETTLTPPQTKTALGLEKAAVIHVDCDLYTSTKLVLAFIEDLLQVGTALLFDDWECPHAKEVGGERRAFEEWPAAARFEELYEHEQWKGFICTKPA